jgi:preprotein translocase subunit Sec61beta
MLDDTGNIALAQIIFFGLATVPSLYCLCSHGIIGLPGWIYVTVFCVIRIVGGAILVHFESETNGIGITPTGLIVSSIAIAPLVMAIAGVAHES